MELVEREAILRTVGKAQGVLDMRGVLKDLADYIVNQSKGDNAMNEVLGNDPFSD